MSVKLSLSVRGSVPRPDFGVAVDRSHKRVGRLGIAAARINFAKHDKTGKTLAGLQAQPLPDGVEWRDPKPGAAAIELGTGLWGPKRKKITAKRAMALRWIGPAGPVFAKSVKGIKPQPWLKPAIEDHADTLIGVYGNAIEREWSHG